MNKLSNEENILPGFLHVNLVCFHFVRRHITESKPFFLQSGRPNLREWLWSSLDGEFCVTQFTVAGVWRWQPLLQAAFVHFTQRTGAVAGREQRLASASLVTNPTHAHIAAKQRQKTLINHSDSDITERSLGSRATSSVLPLQAHRFHDGGEWAAILSGNLGDVLGLRGRIRLLRILGGIGFSATGVIAKRAR